MHLQTAILGALGLLVAACGSSSDAPSTGSTTTAGSGGSGGSGGSSDAATTEGLVGGFVAKLVDADPSTGTPAFSSVLGRVYDGPSPPAFQLVLEKEEAGCQLLKAKVPFCSAGCGTGVCVDTEKCMPYPTAQNVGTVRVQGIGTSEITMDPVAPSFAYLSDTLPNPPCAEGSDVVVQADRFSITGKCITTLALSGPTPIPVKRDQALSLTWTAAGKAGNSRVQIVLDVAHHGGKTGEIDCDVPDTGSFAIPASLVTPLMDLGLAGFPTVQVTRMSTAAAAAHPKVTFAVSSLVERAVDTGVKSCNEDMDCPAGQMCAADRTCK